MGWTDVERDPPSQDADPLDHLLFRQAPRHLTRTALYHRVGSGRWQQPVRSVFVAQTGPIGVPQQRWIGVLASRGPLAGFSALEVLGLEGYRKPYTEILITVNRRVRLPTGHRDQAVGLLDGRGRADRRVAAVDGCSGRWSAPLVTSGPDNVSKVN